VASHARRPSLFSSGLLPSLGLHRSADPHGFGPWAARGYTKIGAPKLLVTHARPENAAHVSRNAPWTGALLTIETTILQATSASMQDAAMIYMSAYMQRSRTRVASQFAGGAKLRARFARLAGACVARVRQSQPTVGDAAASTEPKKRRPRPLSMPLGSADLPSCGERRCRAFPILDHQPRGRRCSLLSPLMPREHAQALALGARRVVARQRP